MFTVYHAFHHQYYIIIIICHKVISEEPHCHPSQQRMDLAAACASCAMPTADESNHSAVVTLHPQHTDGHTMMAYTTA